jgi:flagellar basal body-associated protein FliL
MHQVPNNSVPVRQVDEPKKKKSVMTKILISIGALVAAILVFKFFLGSKKSTE